MFEATRHAMDARRHDRPRRRPRVGMWAVLAVNGLFAWWLVASAGGTDSSCTGLAGSELDACQTGEAVGAGIAAFMVIVLWAMADVICGVLWLVTRPRR